MDEQQKVRTITALALAALAESATPYGIESFDSVLKPLWIGIRTHRGKVCHFVVLYITIVMVYYQGKEKWGKGCIDDMTPWRKWLLMQLLTCRYPIRWVRILKSRRHKTWMFRVCKPLTWDLWMQYKITYNLGFALSFDLYFYQWFINWNDCADRLFKCLRRKSD